MTLDPSQKPTNVRTIRLTDQELRELQKRADREERSVAALIRRIIRDYLKANG